MIRSLTCILVLALHLSTSAQVFSIRQYRAADGLETDIIKCVVQDSLGYIWIGTDEGLLKYDGVSFSQYPEASSSNYIKDFLRTSDGRILMAHDLGVIQINNGPKSLSFETILAGDHVKTSKNLWYPKHLYEDKSGNIWIGEPQSVVRYQGNKWERFDFGPEDNSTSFVRSFSFLDVGDGKVLISSYHGNFFLYDPGENKMLKLPGPQMDFTVNVMKEIDGFFYVGTSIGLFRLDLLEDKVRLKPMGMENNINDLESLQAGDFVVCTEDGPVFLVEIQNDELNITKAENLNSSVNQVFRDGDENLWLSTLRGVQVIRRPQLRNVGLPFERVYIEAIIDDPERNRLFALSKEHLYEIDVNTEETTRLTEYPGGYFLSGAMVGKDLWVSNEFSLLRYENGLMKEEVDLSEKGRYVFDIYKDAEESLWLSQEATDGVLHFDPKSGDIVEYRASKGISTGVTAISGDERGVYVATGSNRDYLFYKSFDSSTFLNISHEILINGDDNFMVEDLVIIDSAVWLATSHGLYLHTEKSIQKIEFNSDLDRMNMRVLLADGGYLWIGNSLGLFRYHVATGDYSQFNEKSGLGINSVTEEGISLVRDKLWVGTSHGVSVMDVNDGSYSKTEEPVIISISSNGVRKDRENLVFEFNSFQEFSFSSLSYPSDEIQYSYRIPEIDSIWSSPDFSRTARIADLIPGSYTLEVRAKKLGDYVWSDSTSLVFKVEPSFFQTPIFYLLIVFALILISLLTRFLTKRIMKRRELILQELVDERTRELKQYQDNLEELVKKRTRELEETQSQLIQSEKMASLGTLTAGVAHEINNPVNYLQAGLYSLEEVFKNQELHKNGNLKETIEEVSKNMQFGVDRIIRIISSLSHFSRKSSKGAPAVCNLHQIIDNCIRILGHEIKGVIELEVSYDPNLPAIDGDEGNLHQLFTNILTNAIHAVQGREGKIRVETKVDTNGIVNVMISDNGEGIDEKNLKNLFDPFFTTKPPGMGTGLGLYISQKIMKDHGGRIEFDSAVGVGTTVILKFM